MNPLVEKMLSLTNEVQALEQIFEHEAKCQSSHRQFPCTVEVVARKVTSCDHKDFLICDSSYRWNMESISDPRRVCGYCYIDTAECWTIRPI